jgi:hypothetical protein
MFSFTQKNESQIKSEDFNPRPDCEDKLFPGFLGGIRRSAVLETLAFLSVAVFLNSFFGDGARFINATPHPFWIIVLLVTVQYGQREAIFAALLASAFLLAGNLPEQSLTETMYDYYFRIFFQPLLWVVSALVLGSIRSRQLREREDLVERLWKSEETAHIFASNYNALRHAKERLELRLAEERRSVLTVYQIARTIHAATFETLVGNIGRIVTVALHPKKFSIFWHKDNALVLGHSFGWAKDDAYAPRFERNSPLMRFIIKHRRSLSIVDENHEKLLDNQGMMAGPIYDEKTGKLLGILKIEEMEFIDMDFNARETFCAVCEWISLACSCADRQRKLKLEEIRMPRTDWFRDGGASSILEIPIPDYFPKIPSELS